MRAVDPTGAEAIVVPPPKLAAQLALLANNREALPDVAFQISGSDERVFAHKALLAAKSPALRLFPFPFFPISSAAHASLGRALLGEEGMGKARGVAEVRLKLDDVSASTFAAFLRTTVYAHTHDTQARKLLDVAQEHGLDSALRRFAEQEGERQLPEEGAEKEPGDASELEVDQLKLMADHWFVDVVLVADGQKASAHKFLLMARSKILRAMFTRYLCFIFNSYF
jgi:hypothetical protein